jgi:hypothetical protein
MHSIASVITLRGRKKLSYDKSSNRQKGDADCVSSQKQPCFLSTDILPTGMYAGKSIFKDSSENIVVFLP